jgi:hypothetical protein
MTYADQDYLRRRIVQRGRNVVWALSALVAMLALAGCSDKTHGSQQTLNLTEPGGNAGTFSPIGHVTRNSAPPGSGFAFSTPLQDSSKKTVGELNAVCIGTQPSKPQALKGTCTGTATVPGGQLALNVGGTIGNGVSGSIVGGTGSYAGATGTFDSKSTGGGGPMNDTFNITLP